jgi:tetratricopeptide (TPR) repeat protein
MKVVVVIALVAVVLGTLCVPALADKSSDRRMAKIRELYKQGDFEGVRAELIAQYDEKPDPALLFALGQVELNLGNYESAISYYEKFIASNPAADQVALAQQGIGAARIRLQEPERAPPDTVDPTKGLPEGETPKETEPPDEPPPPPPPGKRWTVTRTGFVAFGGAAVLLGAGLLYYSHSMGNDHSGTLSEYDRRLDQARTTKWTALGIAAAGTLIIGVTLAW